MATSKWLRGTCICPIRCLEHSHSCKFTGVSWNAPAFLLETNRREVVLIFLQKIAVIRKTCFQKKVSLYQTR